MPTFFEIRTKETKGYATLFVRLQSRPLGVNYKMSTGLEVDIPSWNKAKKSSQAMTAYQDKNPDLWSKLNRLKLTLNSMLDGNVAPTKEEMKQAGEGRQKARAGGSEESGGRKEARHH